MSCSVIIATLDRAASLRLVLECLRQQTRPPDEVIISVAGDETVSAALAGLPFPFPVRLLSSPVKSSAQQRNAAAAAARGDVLAFLDDDIEFPADLFARILGYFDRPGSARLGGVGARLAGEDRRPPGRLTRLYYRLQAGYADADFGGRLFGAGLNCYPVFRPDSPELVPSEWLPATCLFLRAELFHRELFPRFAGYSYAEDVHLTARIARSAPLFFAAHCPIIHHSLPSEFKRDPGALIAGKLQNMRVVARDVLGLHGWSLWWRCQLHRVFMTVVILRGPGEKMSRLRGIWRTAR